MQTELRCTVYSAVSAAHVDTKVTVMKIQNNHWKVL